MKGAPARQSRQTRSGGLYQSSASASRPIAGLAKVRWVLRLGGRKSRGYKPATSFPDKTSKQKRTMAERTFSIIKPDATARNLTGKVNAVIEDSGLRIVAQRRIRMTRAQAEKFYEVHKERPFYGELVDFMTSGPVVVQVLEGDDAVARYRKVMGATNPAQADEGTIRKLYAVNVGENSVHGSDSADNATIEIAQFFTADQIPG